MKNAQRREDMLATQVEVTGRKCRLHPMTSSRHSRLPAIRAKAALAIVVSAYSEGMHSALKDGKHRGIYAVCAPGASRFARRAKPTANSKVKRTSRSRAA